MITIINYLSPIYTDNMDEISEEIVMSHPETESYTVEEFCRAFNAEEISDQGYIYVSYEAGIPEYELKNLSKKLMEEAK